MSGADVPHDVGADVRTVVSSRCNEFEARDNKESTYQLPQL